MVIVDRYPFLRSNLTPDETSSSPKLRCYFNLQSKDAETTTKSPSRKLHYCPKSLHICRSIPVITHCGQCMDTDRGGVEAHRAQSLKIIKQWKVSVSSAAKASQFHTHTKSPLLSLCSGWWCRGILEQFSNEWGGLGNDWGGEKERNRTKLWSTS